MVDISFYSHSTFKISSKKAVIITDPFDPKQTGIKFPKVEASIVLVSDHKNPNHNKIEFVSGKENKKPFVTLGPGEYEIDGVNIVGIGADGNEKEGGSQKITIYQFVIDGIRFGFLGNLVQKLNQEQLEALNEVDVLFVPVGGTSSLSAKEATEVISQVEPKYIIPMHYRESFGQNGKTEIESLADFLKTFGAKDIREKKLSLSKDKLSEEPQVVVLQS